MPGSLTALRALLCLVFAFLLAGTRAEAFFDSPQPAPGILATAAPDSTGENYDGSQYDAPDSLIAANSATASRVKPRKGTLAEVDKRQPVDVDGDMIDPNTGQKLKPGEVDLGHKPGQEWRKRKAMHEEKGSTRKEVLDAENDPDLYQWEDRSSNRSHKHEQK